jgi:drug/metabolite transporter (DMT)-like permease
MLGNGLLCLVETSMPSGIASIIVATVPIWMLLVDAMFSRKAIGVSSWVGLALGTFGVVALAGIGHVSFSIGSAALLIVGAISWAGGSVYARKHADHDNPLVPALEMFVGGWMLLGAGALSGEFSQFHAATISAASIAGFVWLVTAGALVGYSAYGYAVRHLPTKVTATYAYVNPVVAVALGAIVLHEPVTLNVLIGGAAVVLAVVAILKPAPEKKEDRAGRNDGTADERVARLSDDHCNENGEQHGEETQGCEGMAGDAA